MLRKLAKDLRTAEDRFEHLVESPLRVRLAELLIAFLDHYGTTFEDGQPILNIRLSRKEIAKLLGATTESVIRQISSFKKENLVWSKNNAIAILNPDKLRQMVNPLT